MIGCGEDQPARSLRQRLQYALCVMPCIDTYDQRPLTFPERSQILDQSGGSGRIVSTVQDKRRLCVLLYNFEATWPAMVLDNLLYPFG